MKKHKKKKPHSKKKMALWYLTLAIVISRLLDKLLDIIIKLLNNK